MPLTSVLLVPQSMEHLSHEARLAISVAILLRVQLVHQTRLLPSRASGIVVRAGSATPVASTRAHTARSITAGVDARIKLVFQVGCAIARAGAAAIIARAGVVTCVVAGATRHARGRTSQSTTNSFWLTLEAIIALLATGKATTLLLEIGHADSRKGRCRVMLGLILMDLVDRDGGVDNRWLNSLLLDDRLDGLHSC